MIKHKELTSPDKPGIIPWRVGAYLCNEVHDELVVDSWQEDYEDVQTMMREVMTQETKKIIQSIDPTFDAYLGVEEGLGSHWHKQEGE